MQYNQDEGLGYVSSSANFIDVDPKIEVNTNDEADMPALVKVLELINDRKAYYVSIASLSVRDADFSVEEQLLVNQKVVNHLDEIQVLINDAIGKVKEAQYGRQ